VTPYLQLECRLDKRFNNLFQNFAAAALDLALLRSSAMLWGNNNNLQAFQLIVLARYLLGVPKP